MEDDLNILIIETDPSISAGLEERLNHLGFHLCCNALPDGRIDQLEDLSPDLAILGPSIDTETSLKCIHKLKIVNLSMPILTPCEACCLPEGSDIAPFEGVHYFSPDLDPIGISEAIHIALKHMSEYASEPDYPVIIGQSREIRGIRQKIGMVSDKDITVLITGESGTGKELIARSIHRQSQRSKGPLVKINCGALPDELLESEVFGFHKGAFTGAHKDKPGRLEQADGGTLFIDEIGVLSLSLQVKFLQVLEDKAFSRLGGTQDKIVDTRVVAATNSDLWEKVRERTFRKDLFYRLNVIQVVAPPLRERREDIALLTHYFMNKYCFEFRKELLSIPERIANLFFEYHWPGNVRELENVIRRAITVRDWDFIFEELKWDESSPRGEHRSFSGINRSLLSWDEKLKEFFDDSDFSLKKMTKAYIAEVESQEILKALEATHWNRRKAAELLQVSYKTLLNRILELDLKPL